MSLIDVLNQYDTIIYYREQDCTDIKSRQTCTYDSVYENDFGEIVMAAENGNCTHILSDSQFSYTVKSINFNRDLIIIHDIFGHELKLIAKKI